MRKEIIASLGIGLLVVSIIGCSKSNPAASPSGGNPLVGTWNMTQRITITPGSANDTANASATNSATYVISANNTFSQTQNSPTNSGSMNGTWSSTVDSVTFTIPMLVTQKCAYAISGSALTLTYEEDMFASTATVIEKYAKQ